MSGDESSDGLEELKDLMAIYAKHESKGKKPKSENVEPVYVEVPTEKVIFGDKQAFLTNLAKSVGQKRTKADSESERKGAAGSDDDDENPDKTSKKHKPAWVDSDDEDIELGEVKRRTRHTGPLKHLRKDKSYKEYLTARFQRVVSQPKWASLDRKEEQGDGDSDDSEDEPLLKTVGFINHKAKALELAPKVLRFKRTRDLNRATYSEGVITSIQYHPTSTAALVAGESCLANLYSVNGAKNEKLHSIRFKKFPIMCARIAPCGTKAFFGSTRPMYYAYDLLEANAILLKLPENVTNMRHFEVSPCGKYIAVAGKFGAIHLLTSHTNELLHSFKQEDSVRSMCFTEDSQRLICNSSGCNVSVISLRQQDIEHTFIDDGCVNGRSMDLAPNQRLLATGSNEGVVNVYDYESIYKSSAPKPEKSFMNLRTAVTNLQFNPTSELLAMSSRQVANALKLAHFPSATVYTNFPGQHEQVGFVNTVAFSPNSGFVALGTTSTKAPLFRIKHFKNY